jgi:hypothetical protein
MAAQVVQIQNLNPIQTHLNDLNSTSMKTKITLLIATAAVVTLSFTFATTSRVDKKQVTTSKIEDQSAPAGGFALDEK